MYGNKYKELQSFPYNRNQELGFDQSQSNKMKLFLVIFCILVHVQNSYSQLHSTDLMEEHGIIPDIIDTVPRDPIEVRDKFFFIIIKK